MKKTKPPTKPLKPQLKGMAPIQPTPEQPKEAPAPRKPLRPTEAAVLLREKLQALVARGVNGEAAAAKHKLERLEKRYDFTIQVLIQRDIFQGSFERSGTARLLCVIADPETANAVKWAIQERTGIHCLFRGPELLAEAADRTAKRLQEICQTLNGAIETLWTQFRKAPGTNPLDRALFIRGLYDGMMGDEHPPGEPLPKRIGESCRGKAKKGSVGHVAGIKLHPYSIAVPLGRDIRVTMPIEEVTNRLNAAIVAALPESTK